MSQAKDLSLICWECMRSEGLRVPNRKLKTCKGECPYCRQYNIALVQVADLYGEERSPHKA